MVRAGLTGLRPGGAGAQRPTFRASPTWSIATSRSQSPMRSWITDITGAPHREGKLYCCVVLDAYSRPGGRLVDRRQSGRVPGDQRARHGAREPLTSAGHDPSLRPRHAVCVLDLHHQAKESGFSPRWDRSATASTTPSPRPSGPGCRWSCSTAASGARAWSSPTRSSSTSRSSTIASAGTPRSGCARRSSTRCCTRHVDPCMTSRSTGSVEPRADLSLHQSGAVQTNRVRSPRLARKTKRRGLVASLADERAAIGKERPRRGPISTRCARLPLVEPAAP